MKNKFDLKGMVMVDGKFYYGWVVLLCAAMPMFICYVVKSNCAPLFIETMTAELGISRTAYTQTNTVMTFSMLITSFFIGAIFKKFPVKWVFAGTSLLTTICYVVMSRATNLTQLLILSAIQGIGWAGNTSLSASIMVGNWFGPKVKGTALSIAMLGSAVGALVWITPVNNAITNYGWRTGFIVLAGINMIAVIMALFVFDKPADKGFSRRVGDPMPGEVSDKPVETVDSGITAVQAVKTARWWLQWTAAFVTMIGAAGFTYHCKAYLAEINGGDSAAAAAIYAGALGTLVLGKFLVGFVTDIIKVKRTAVIAPLFFCGVFVCLALSAKNFAFTKVMVPFYMIGGAIPSMIPFLINARNFGNKNYSILQGWMIMAGNAGQIVGPTVASAVYDITGEYGLAWMIFAALMLVVAVLYFLSTRASTKKIADWGYVAVD